MENYHEKENVLRLKWCLLMIHVLLILPSQSYRETKDIANVLRAGKLPASAEIVQSEIVGPSLGQEAIESGFLSFVIAMGFVLVWMIFYYGRAGIYADIALLFDCGPQPETVPAHQRG